MAATSLLLLMLAKTAQCRKNCSWANFKVGQHGYASVSSVASQTMQPGFCLWICQLLFQKTGVLHFLVPDHALLSCLDSASSDPQQGGATFTVDHRAASNTRSYQTPCTAFQVLSTVSSLLVCLKCKLHQPPVPVFQWLLFAGT